MPPQKDLTLRDFLLRSLAAHPDDIAPFAAARFGVTRATISNYLKDLAGEGLIEMAGRTNARTCKLHRLTEFGEAVELTPGAREDNIFRNGVRRHLTELPPNIYSICEHGFLEMMNNAIVHSGGSHAYLTCERDYATVKIRIFDNGIGIFEKIARDCHLGEDDDAILELAIGRFTTSASAHKGKGIFLVSRMFDRFEITSKNLVYTLAKDGNGDWQARRGTPAEAVQGTIISMAISTNAPQTVKDIYDRFLGSQPNGTGAHVPMVLAQIDDESFVSRSQAHRVLAQLARFSDITLDFHGVAEIGQAFADEIFRVWADAHPDISLRPLNPSPDVDRVIRHAMASSGRSFTHGTAVLHSPP